MEPLHLTYEQLMFFMLINFVIGLVLGLITLIVGIKKNKLKLGILGFLGSTIGGGIVGLLLSLPIMGIFLWLILKKPSADISAKEESNNETELL